MQKSADLILDFTHTYAKDWIDKFPALHYLDCSDIGGTDMYCTVEAQAELERRLQAYPINGVHFLDSGNYHYLTRLFTKRIGQPYQLIFFDNHNDMQPSMIPNLLSCGAWAKQVLEEDSYLERMFLIGPSQSSINEIPSDIQPDKRKKLVCISWEELQEERSQGLQNKLGNTDMLSTQLPIYLSIDKDVLSEKYAQTNWDQGEMELSTLKEILQWIKSRNRIIGVDICGEFAAPPPFQESEVRCINEGTNEALYEMLVSAVAHYQVVEFHGETFKALSSDRDSYVFVNGVRHDILPKTLSKFKNCSNAKEYVEAIECFAYSVLIEKSIFNDRYFTE